MSFRLPPELIPTLTRRLTEGEKTWEKFNEDVKFWEVLEYYVYRGLISSSDLPPKPDPADYAQ